MLAVVLLTLFNEVSLWSCVLGTTELRIGCVLVWNKSGFEIGCVLQQFDVKRFGLPQARFEKAAWHK